MHSVPTFSEIRQTKQLISTPTLLRWAEESGFKHRRSRHGTSHIICQHTRYPDITFLIVADTDKPSSQLDFSDALKKIYKREAALTADFEKNAQRQIEIVYRSLPSHLVATHDYERGRTVLRDRALPQVGVTIPFAEAHMLENKIHNIIEPVKREVCELLSRARVGYDIAVLNRCGKDKDTMALRHTIYDLPVQYIQPYKPDEDPRAVLGKIYRYIQLVEEKDFDHELRLETALKHEFIDSVSVSFHARRGERVNTVSAHDRDGRPVTLSFETASNRRALPGDVYGARIAERELRMLEYNIGAMTRAHSAHAWHAA